MNEEVDLQHAHMRSAIALSAQNISGVEGGPFGAVIVKNGLIVGKGKNNVLVSNDPTAHAEVCAIRAACHNLETHSLQGCEIYTSCEPCPMCLGAIYWAQIDKIYYANTQNDADTIGFSDAFLYNEFKLEPHARSKTFQQILRNEANQVFKQWASNEDKKLY